MALRESINSDLKVFIENSLPKLYLQVDYAHQWDLHIKEVIEHSFEIAELVQIRRSIKLSSNIIYATAAYHDIGLLKGRDNHEKNSAHFIRTHAIKNLGLWFNNKEILTICEAVEDHRASVGRKARSVYGEIVADADKVNSAEMLLLRCWLYRLDEIKEDLSNKDEAFEGMYAYILEKYGIEGYSKLQSSEGIEINKSFRAEITKIANDKVLCKKKFEEMIKIGSLPRPSEVKKKMIKPIYQKW